MIWSTVARPEVAAAGLVRGCPQIAQMDLSAGSVTPSAAFYKIISKYYLLMQITFGGSGAGGIGWLEVVFSLGSWYHHCMN